MRFSTIFDSLPLLTTQEAHESLPIYSFKLSEPCFCMPGISDLARLTSAMLDSLTKDSDYGQCRSVPPPHSCFELAVTTQ